jgi:hydrogenase maturation protein HypF
MQVRKAIEVSGIVQGVGFRPYVYRLANEQQLAGSICNTAAGVSIEVQGTQSAVDDFLARLPADSPPLARITDITVREIACNGDREFQIVTTHRGEPVQTLISPDVAVCDDCLREMSDPADRRYRYPFINCTNCGPRFTIVRNIPYDRPFTSMAGFAMCTACQAEYDDPRNRRFHAQPNACWQCGPQVGLWGVEGNRIEVADPIAATVARLQCGEVAAIKGLGGFHLACDATNADAVRTLRECKRRVEKPFAAMVPDVDAAQRFCEVDHAARQLLLSSQRPIVLLRRREDTSIADEVAPFNRYLGVFLPYTPLHHLLFDGGGFEALVMTSANLSEEPICIANDEAVRRLHRLADCFLVHNRDILLRCDDSVARVAGGRSRQLRRSRGFVPVPVFLREDVPSVLAVGGELKNTICLTKGRHAFLSQHIGDLENAESYSFFEEAIEHLQRILEIAPVAIAYDLHPNYFSTRWSLAQSELPQIGVQHHHAHIASCMAENHLEGRVIGIALDGTGYGTDGRIWGGEVLLADYSGFERAAHLAYVPLPGGEAAIREPWRMAVSYLVRHFGCDFVRALPLVADVPEKNLNVLFRMMEQGINSPLTSSCGRLFDAVAALAGIRRQVNYEAQAAIELEIAIGKSQDETAYSFDLTPDGEGWIIDTRTLFEAVLRDVAREVSVGDISRRFHNGLADVLCEVVVRLRERSGLQRVCLSGGTFQNVYLFEGLCQRMRAAGFQVFTHSEVPAGDGGLSLGQALVAARTLAQPRVSG